MHWVDDIWQVAVDDVSEATQYGMLVRLPFSLSVSHRRVCVSSRLAVLFSPSMSQKWSNSRFSSRPTGASTGISSRVPAFKPPSFYAAAGGLTPRIEPIHSKERSLEEPENVYQQPQGVPLSYPTADVDGAEQILDEIQESRHRKRSISRSFARAMPKVHKENDSKQRQGSKRQMIEIPFLETQLLPSLRDTIDKMTHPPRQASHEDQTMVDHKANYQENVPIAGVDVSRTLVMPQDHSASRSPVIATGYSSVLASTSKGYARSVNVTPTSGTINSPHLLGTPSANANRQDRSPVSKAASRIPSSSRASTKSNLRVDPAITPHWSSLPDTPLLSPRLEKSPGKSLRSTKGFVASDEATHPVVSDVTSLFLLLPNICWR